MFMRVMIFYACTDTSRGIKVLIQFIMQSVFMIKYKDGLILTQENIIEPSDQDPNEGQDWNWEEYE